MKKARQERFEKDAGELLRALAARQAEAIAFLFDEYARSLCFYCQAILHDDALAEDVVQETFVRLWEGDGQFSDLVSLRAFLYRVGRNISIDLLKHRNVRRKHEPHITREFSEDFLNEKLIEEELIGELHRAAEQLPVACARVFKLSLTGATNQEIADRLSLSIHTVKTQKQRALAVLKERFHAPRDKDS
jgi:RNA polymerase sigma-70 factor (ECF subfamily)